MNISRQNQINLSQTRRLPDAADTNEEMNSRESSPRSPAKLLVWRFNGELFDLRVSLQVALAANTNRGELAHLVVRHSKTKAPA